VQGQVRDAAREAGPRQLSAVPGDGAKPVVREPAGARQLRALLTGRGEPAENVETIVAVAARHLQQPRVYVGKVIQHGQAPFEFDTKNALNYFLKLQTPAGERTIWSVDLKRALDEGRVGTGDNIAIEHRGFRPVTVVVPERDASGQVVGSHDEVVQRNTWYAVGIERLREEALLARAAPGPERGAAGRGTEPAATSAGPAGEAGEAAGNAKPLPARPVQALEEQRQTEPRSIARDAMVWEALEVAFEVGNVPAAQRDVARLKVQKELDALHARGEPVKVGVIDPAAPRQVPRTAQMPQRQREPVHDRSR
jgi:hypothetical protein